MEDDSEFVWYWWQSTSIIHSGYRVEYEVRDVYRPGGGSRQEYTGKHRYVPA